MDPTLLRALTVIASSYLINMAVIPPNPPASQEERNAYKEGKKTRDPLIISLAAMVNLYLAVSHSVNAAELAAIAVDKLPFIRNALLRPEAVGSASLRLLVGNGAPIYLSSTGIFGFACILAGSLLRRYCFRTLAKQFTYELSLKKDHKLVTEGPYSVVRHPSYTALVTVIVGVLMHQLGEGSWWMTHQHGGWLRVAYTAVMVIIYISPMVHRCSVEDGVLREHFGEQWHQWAKKTPYRLVPFVW